MRRTFAFRCRMLPEACAFRSQSFGSEAKAKADMKRHLIEHVAAICASPEAGIRVESVVARKRKRLLHATGPPAGIVKMERDPGTPPPQQPEPPTPPPAPVLVKQVRQYCMSCSCSTALQMRIMVHAYIVLQVEIMMIILKLYLRLYANLHSRSRRPGPV